VNDQLHHRLAAVMFVDMVGFTAKVERDELASRHDRDQFMTIVREHHEAMTGEVVKTLGDGVLSMFASVVDATNAAVAIQRDLIGCSIDARVGIHAGEVVLDDGDLFGDVVNIASRVESFAEPGCVLLSDAARALVANRPDIEVISLGEFRLKNVGRPVELFAISAPGIVVPSTTSFEAKGERYAVLPLRLPNRSNSILGRDSEIASLAAIVAQHRIVTITGPGGVGKTTLATELAWQLSSEFPDGVAFAPMADVSRPEEFLAALAAILDVKEAEQRSYFDGIVALIGDASVLIVLDNLEQLVEASGDVARLVAACNGLRIIATSRAPLRVSAEREFALAPLPVPTDDALGAPEQLLTNASVALFVDRARLVAPGFELTDANARFVAGICQRLDGLPLALELAAPRLRLLSCEALLERLGHALDTLGAGPRDAHERQRTLRATIAWSHELLATDEQRLFRRLSVFVGGFTLDDVERVCSDGSEDVVPLVEALVDKALVTVHPLTGRFSMLQTISEFSTEQLATSGEADEFAMRHALHYAALAQTIREGVEGNSQIPSIELGIVEERNLEAAIATLLRSAQQGNRDAGELGLRVCGELLMYWHIRGKNISAHEGAVAFLAAQGPSEATSGRAGALMTAGLAQWILGLNDDALSTWSEAVAVAEQAGAQRELCFSEFAMALGFLTAGDERARVWSQRSIEHARQFGLTWSEGFALTIDAMGCAMVGDAAAATSEFQEALRIQRHLGDEEGAGMTLSGLASISASRADYDAALDLYQQALEAFETCGDRGEEARVLSETAWTALDAGDNDLAQRKFLDAVQAHTDVASVRGVGMALMGLAATEVARGRLERAATLAAAAEFFTRQEGIVVAYTPDSPGQAAIANAWNALSPEDASRVRVRGEQMSLSEALAFARDVK
jgi:predicted ATPase